MGFKQSSFICCLSWKTFLTGNVLLLEKGGEAINVDDKLILDRKCELCVSPAALDTGRAQVLFKESKIKCSVQVA